jgi:hypothetical protein
MVAFQVWSPVAYLVAPSRCSPAHLFRNTAQIFLARPLYVVPYFHRWCPNPENGIELLVKAKSLVMRSPVGSLAVSVAVPSQSSSGQA